MPRHPFNSNLSLYHSPSFNGHPLQDGFSPFILEYLDRLDCVIRSSLDSHSRVFAFRFDLRLSSSSSVSHDGNECISRFIASLKAKLSHRRSIAARHNPYAHQTTVRYVWCRENRTSLCPHYHFLVLLNNDAFFTLGRFELGRQNLFNCLVEAWASALSVEKERAAPLVHIPDNNTYLVIRGDQDSFNSLFFRASYLCKAATKSYRDYIHSFGSSRG